MESLLIIAYISAIGVWGNLVLQSVWFYWSINVQKRKHYTDDQEISDTERIENMFKVNKETYEREIDKHKRELNWEEFNQAEDSCMGRSKFEPKRGSDGKYNPEDISGNLDAFFGENNES